MTDTFLAAVPIPPPLPIPKRRDWWSRNWMWFVPVLVVGAVAVLGGFFFSVFGVMRSSDAYRGAVTRAKAAPAVIEALGQPISEAYWFTGSVQTKGTTGQARLLIPLKGTKASGLLLVQAEKANGVWRYPLLIVQLGKDTRSIDLSDRTK